MSRQRRNSRSPEPENMTVESAQVIHEHLLDIGVFLDSCRFLVSCWLSVQAVARSRTAFACRTIPCGILPRS